MKKWYPFIFLALGLVCFILFWSTDFVGSAIGKQVLRAKLQGSFQGDCSREDDSYVRVARQVFLSFRSIPLFTISEGLNGLRLGVLVYPFHLEDKHGNHTFMEMGPWALKMEVEGNTLWIMKDHQHSNMNAEQPINNVNLLTFLSPMVMDELIPGLLPGVIPEPPVVIEPRSIRESVEMALNATETIMQEFNITAEHNDLREIYEFLTTGGDAALAYRGSLFELGERGLIERNVNTKSFQALSFKDATYNLPGLDRVTFEYIGTSQSDVAGIEVDKYKVKDIWTPEILCQVSNSLLGMYKRLEYYGVYLTSPGKIRSGNYATITLENHKAATLDLYRPFSVPIAGSVVTQVNVNMPKEDELGSLQGDTTPLMRVVVTVERLPDEEMRYLLLLIRLRMAFLMVFLSLGSLFLVLSALSFMRYRNQRRKRFDNLMNTPL